DALRIFEEAARNNPGIETLTDLAVAQQRAERWMEALGTWKKIQALTPASRKREIATSLLRVYERLSMRREAGGLLLEMIDAQTDDKDRFALFADLLAHCTRHAMLDWLRTEFENRRKLRADDYFTGMALGRVLKALGEKSAA